VLSSLACFAGLIGLGLKLHNVRGPVAVNERADRLVFGHLFGVSVVPDWAARSYRELGQPVPFAILTAAIVAVLVWRRDLADAAVAALGAPIAVLLADAVAKPVFDRTSGSSVSQFPSGHTTAMTAVGVLLVLVAYRRWGRRGVVISLPVAAWVSGSMIVSVIRLQQHVLTDAIGGVLLGVATVTAVAAAVSAVAESVQPEPRRAGWLGRRWLSPLVGEPDEPAFGRLRSAAGAATDGGLGPGSSPGGGLSHGGLGPHWSPGGGPPHGGLGPLGSPGGGLPPAGLGPLSSAAAPPPVPGPASAGAAGPDTASDGPRRSR
jgi:membrane-associated phospholipid phosphatase